MKKELIINNDPSLSITETDNPSDEQLRDIQNLVSICRQRDGISLSCPLDSDDPVQHFLLYGKARLLSVLSVLPYDEETAECTAFTHPDLRRRGYFSLLFTRALEVCTYLEECDILFPASDSCPDTLATLHALEAELCGEELQMELFFSQAAMFDISPDFSLRSYNTNEELLQKWKLYQNTSSDTRQLGSCQTSFVSETCVCLHHVEILPQFRSRGYGNVLMQLLIREFAESGLERMILQVAGDNEPAIALYKKQGFRITETLSYYLY